MTGSAEHTIDQVLENPEPDRGAAPAKLRRAILETTPDATETLSLCLEPQIFDRE